MTQYTTGEPVKINGLQQSIAQPNSVTPKAFGVIADIMDSKKKLRNTRIVLGLGRGR